MEKKILSIEKRAKKLRKKFEEIKEEIEAMQNKDVKEGFIDMLNSRIEILNMAEKEINDIHKSESLSESEKETLLSSLEWLI